MGRRKNGQGLIRQRKDGKREQHIVYAKSEEECERKLGEMIKELKNKAVV